jgi:signal recognition particle subunit SRP68
MDITSFIIQGRDKALLYGDYSTYHGQLSKRLLNSRKKLGTVTRNRGKFRKAEQVTAEDVQTNNEYDITDPLLSSSSVSPVVYGRSGAD